MRHCIFLLIAAAVVTVGVPTSLHADHRHPRNNNCAPSRGPGYSGAGWHKHAGSGWHSFAGDDWYSGGAYHPRYDHDRYDSFRGRDNCWHDDFYNRGYGGAYGYGYGGAYGYGGLYGVDPFYRSGRGVELNSGRFRIQFGF